MNEAKAMEAAREILGDDGVTVQRGDGHAGPGWYAWHTEYPEEGSVHLGRSDE